MTANAFFLFPSTITPGKAQDPVLRQNKSYNLSTDLLFTLCSLLTDPNPRRNLYISHPSPTVRGTFSRFDADSLHAPSKIYSYTKARGDVRKGQSRVERVGKGSNDTAIR
jgi:hypothetical protein